MRVDALAYHRLTRSHLSKETFELEELKSKLNKTKKKEHQETNTFVVQFVSNLLK